jgi:hypothetical protein
MSKFQASFLYNKLVCVNCFLFKFLYHSIQNFYYIIIKNNCKLLILLDICKILSYFMRLLTSLFKTENYMLYL